MHPFVDLSRRFRDLTDAELEEPELLVSLSEHEFLSVTGWPELLRHPRVLLLAEAGSGKTTEMREQAKCLTAQSRYAFFVALESLDRDNLTDLLSAEEECAFAAWKADGRSPAWFFLDAVDELKLTQGKLERALSRFARTIDGLLDRAHIVISCRPSDWRPDLDMATLQAKLPTPTQSHAMPPDEVFLAALRKEEGIQQLEESPVKGDGIRTVVLLPMSKRQIETFSRSFGVKDPAAFIAEIHKQHAWTFARRPLDLSELLATWKDSGKLGTRAEQHEANVAFKLKDDPERADRGVLSDARARLGAERIALALALTRTRMIRSPEQAVGMEHLEGVFDSSEVLPDWDENQRQTLLRRALFDPATYGRIRFHHPSVQEYLAARRLRALREKGMSAKKLFRFFFAECYGVAVVIPSMRAIAAWLALWDEDVRRELMKREPEVLLSLGDPETLPINARTTLVRAFADAYGKGGSRRLNIPIEEVRRLAHPELTEVIRELWGDGPANEDVRELLLELIWQGAIEGCADIAASVANNFALPPYHRVVGLRALIACNRVEMARAIADSILQKPDRWSNQIVHGLASDLFPKIITVAELIALVERTYEPDETVGGIASALLEITEAVDPWSDKGVELREKLADLIWRTRYDEQERYQIKSRFDHTAPALALLCDRQLSAAPMGRDSDLIHACVIANRFAKDETGPREPIGKLRQHFSEGSALRAAAFWAELALMDELVPAKNDDYQRMYQTEDGSVVGHLTETDRDWLEVTLINTGTPQRRAVALQALIQLWVQRGRIAAEVDVLREMVKDDARLTHEVSKGTAPREPNAVLKQMERNNRRRRCAKEEHEQQRVVNWIKWRDELLADPATAFGPNNCLLTVHNLHTWLNARRGAQSRYNVWDADALRQAFGSEIAQRSAKAFQAVWRSKSPPTLWSSRPPEERNRTPLDWIYGLCGIAAEATSPEWATRLTSTEAELAAAYATVELNGFASWLGDLAAAHPKEVDSVLGAELTMELTMGAEHSHLPTLQDLAHAGINVKRLLTPRLLTALPTWPSTFADKEAGHRWAHHLDRVIRILDETSGDQDRITVASECDVWFAADPDGPLALVWLRGLFRFDPERGTQALENALAAISDPRRTEHAIEVFAALFGDRDGVLLDIKNPSARAAILGRLVRCAYNYVRREEDQEHQGVYSPNTRDDAETARNFLLSALVDTPGPEAHRILHELATEPLFAHFHDRLRLLARKRAASDAEFEPFSPAALVALEECLEAPPHDRDGLFNVMVDRLDDLSHDIAHDDFTNRRTLRTIEEESEMQRTLARQLREMAKGAYLVIREDEVADQKRTDIRLVTVHGNQKAAIEVKIADKWSMTDLERALRNQLVGQYLRHGSSKAGCLLLTYGTNKYWKHPETGVHLSFPKVIDYLASVAKEIERDMAYGVRLKVYGLDLTDPVLKPAHRQSQQ